MAGGPILFLLNQNSWNSQVRVFNIYFLGRQNINIYYFALRCSYEHTTTMTVFLFLFLL